jgi:glutathione S-transferase
MKLYFAPRSRAVRVRWLMEELETPYELVRLEDAKQLADHPALEDGEVTLHEHSAICLLHLADRFPEKNLAPAVGTADRGSYYQWMSFAEGRIEPAVMEIYRQSPLPEHQARASEALRVVDQALGGRQFLVGGRFTAADVMMASILHLAHSLKLVEPFPRLLEYVRFHTGRPASRKAVMS